MEISLKKDWGKEGTELIKGFNERLMKRKKASRNFLQADL